MKSLRILLLFFFCFVKPSAPIVLEQSGVLVCNSGGTWSFELALVEFDTVFNDVMNITKRTDITENMIYFDFGTTIVSNDGLFDHYAEMGYIIYHTCKKTVPEMWTIHTITAPLWAPDTYTFENFFYINLLEHWNVEIE